MSDKLIKAAIGVDDALARHARLLDIVGGAENSAVIRSMGALGENSAIQRMLADMDRTQEMMRIAVGPLVDLRRAGIFEQNAAWGREIGLASRVLADFEGRFRLPELGETARLFENFSKNLATEGLVARSADLNLGIQKALEGIQSPWLDMQDTLRSVGGLAAVQSIGLGLKNMPAFGADFGAALRIDLGDWRDPITWPAEIFTDYSARSGFYADLGFNPALTDFPAEAFEESLDIAELRRDPPTLVDLYGSPTTIANEDDDDEETSFARTNMAHDWLFRLETQVRRFIDAVMTEAFGPDWPKHQLPNGLYDKWQEKKRKAQQNGAGKLTLIAYADFTDYVLIIGKRDNWRAFEPFFGRQEDVRESFQRLHPIRLDTMHARPITQDDELLLFVETRRLIKVIRKKTQ